MDDTDPMVSVMKLEKAPSESYADIGGLDQQIQEIKVSLIIMTCTYTHAANSYNGVPICVIVYVYSDCSFPSIHKTLIM